MIIKNLSIKGFGKLKNIDINLTPGLNIIFGQNESGKSTILSFIKGIFYGLDKKNKNGLSDFDKYKPWNSEEYTGMVEYEFDRHSYKVGRNFNTNKVSICNELWEDISNLFPKDKKMGPLFADEHLGLSDDLFERTIFFEQQNTRIIDNKEIIDKLINIQQSGEEETSLKSAVDILEDAIRDQIGNNKSKKRPINILEEQINDLEKEKKEILNLRDTILKQEEKIKEEEFEQEGIIKKLEEAKQVKEALKKSALIDSYNKALKYESDIELMENEISRLKPFENFPISLENRLKEILFEIKKCNENIFEKEEQFNKLNASISNEVNIKDTTDIALKLELLKHTCEEKEINLDELRKLENSYNKLQEDFSKLSNLHDEQKQILARTYGRQLADYDNKLSRIENIIEKLKEHEQRSKSISATIIDQDSKSKNKIFLYDIENLINNYNELIECNKKIASMKSTVSVNDYKDNSKKIAAWGFITLIISIVMVLCGFVLFSTSLSIKYSILSLGTVVGIISVIRIITSYKRYRDNYKKGQELSDSDISIKELNDLISQSENLKKRISEFFNLFNIKHNVDAIGDLEISELKKKFIENTNMSNKAEFFNEIEEEKKRISEGIGQFQSCNTINFNELELFCNDLKFQKQSITSKLNELFDIEENITQSELKKRIEIIEGVDYHSIKIDQIKENIDRINEKIVDLLNDLSVIGDEYSIKVDIKDEINKSEVESLEKEFANIIENKSDTIKVSTIKETIQSDLTKLKEKLNQLENEKRDIFEASLVQDEDEFFENIKKYQRINELNNELGKLREIYFSYFNGQCSQDFLKKAREIQDDFTNTKDYNSELIENDISQLSQKLKEIDEELLKSKLILNNCLEGRMGLNEIAEKIQKLKSDKLNLENKRDSIQVAIDILKETSAQIQRDFSPKFQSELTHIINKITGEKYNKVKVSENLNLNVLSPEIGQIVNIDNLSVGTIEQFYLGLRIALANLFSKKGEKLPLLIDEAFVYFDDNRVKNALEFLLEESKERQIVIFTCQNREIDTINNLGRKDINIVNL